MSVIKYYRQGGAPNFPPQNGTSRYIIDGNCFDVEGGRPSASDISDYLTPPVVKTEEQRWREAFAEKNGLTMPTDQEVEAKR